MTRILQYLIPVLVALAVFYLGLRFFQSRLPGPTTVYYGPRYSSEVFALSQAQRITQEIRAVYPGLYRIDLYFEKYPAPSQETVTFRLKDSCSASTDLVTVTVEYAQLTDGEPYPFIFPPLDDSAGRDYCFVVESDSAVEEPAVGIFASELDVYPVGEARYHDNSPQVNPPAGRELPHQLWLPLVQKSPAILGDGFDVGFRLHYNGPAYLTIAALLNRLASEKPGPFGQPGFYMFLVGVYVVVLVLLFRVVVKIGRGL